MVGALLAFTIAGDKVDLGIVVPLIIASFMLNMGAFFFMLKWCRERIDNVAQRQRRINRGMNSSMISDQKGSMISTNSKKFRRRNSSAADMFGSFGSDDVNNKE
jgi:hypothetical protein